MDPFAGWPIWKTFCFVLLWTPPIVLVHELGHAVAALRLTSGPVVVTFGRDPLRSGREPWAAMRLGRVVIAVSGFGHGACHYDPGQVRGSFRSEAWIAAAGPLASLAMGIALALPAMSSGGAARDLLAFGAACSVLCVIVSAWPMHYEQGLGGQAESDGMAVWRILTGGPPRPLVKRKPKKDKDIVIARPGYLIALGLLLLLAFALRPKFGFELLGLFAAAVLFQVWVERSP